MAVPPHFPSPSEVRYTAALLEGASQPPLSLEALQQFVEARKSMFQESIAEMRSNPAYLFTTLWNDVANHPLGVIWTEAVLPTLSQEPSARAQRLRYLNVLLHRAFCVRVWRTYFSLSIFTFIGNNLAKLKDSGFCPPVARGDLVNSKRQRLLIWEINFLIRNTLMLHLRCLLYRALAASARMSPLFIAEFVCPNPLWLRIHERSPALIFSNTG